ncbi:hypothetical protein QVD17_08108 [Tagetes erecta]|uniref:LOB domain-containing protein n=1 Tax=Tagetes erecta TaxID=13708 RepID=A0AAD8L462_TARER|nr:hypothetical protein QVD17_08108 [Tagetes erecta]
MTSTEEKLVDKATKCDFCRNKDATVTSCFEDCVFSPLLAEGSVTPKELSCILQVFSSNFVTRFVEECPSTKRLRIIKTFVQEAKSRDDDKVYGATTDVAVKLRIVESNEKEILKLESELLKLKASKSVAATKYDALGISNDLLLKQLSMVEARLAAIKTAGNRSK